MSQTRNYQADSPERGNASKNASAGSHKAQDAAHDSATERLQHEAKQAGKEVREQVDTAVEEAKQKSKELAVEAQKKAQAFANEQQKAAAQQIDGVAKALQTTADQLQQEQAWLASGVGQTAKALENTAESLRTKDVNTLISDLQSYARKQPALVLGGAAVVGFLLSRFLKSSAQRQPHDYDSGAKPAAGTVSTGPSSY